jgi:curli biogenesis system outer membrane secretion channel CsgG
MANTGTRRREMKMKRYALVLLLTVILFSLCSCGHLVKSYSKPDIQLDGKSVGIMPFSSNIPEVGKVVSDTIGANLLESGFKIVDRTHIGKILQEEGISYLEIDFPDYNKIGNLAEVNFLLVGNVAFSSATVRLVDTATGETLIVAVFRPSRITGSASAVDMGLYLAKSIGKEIRSAR